MGTLDQRYGPILVENDDDIGRNTSANRPLVEIYEARLQRRAVLKGFVTAAAAGAFGGGRMSRIALAAGAAEESLPTTLAFESIP